MFFVYLVTNLVNQKLYVGKTANIEKRWRQHLKIAQAGRNKFKNEYQYFHSAISKYGPYNFSIETLGNFDSEEQAFDQEKKHIAQFKAEGRVLYNLTAGGEGTSGLKHSVESRKQISLSKRGNPGGFLGHSHSEITRRQISDLRVGSKLSDETKSKISLANTGRKLSEEHKKKLFAKVNGRHSSAKLSWEKVKKIRELFSLGLSYKNMSKLFSVHKETIRLICLQITWKQ